MRKAPGTCALCGHKSNAAGIIQHLKNCASKEEGPIESGETLYRLKIESPGGPWWLIVEVRAQDTLQELDRFLRRIWLECCGHMSAFTIGKTQYTRHPMNNERPMSTPLSEALPRQNVKFIHEYDFGTTTELALRVIDKRLGNIGKDIRLLARNDPPVWKCADCDSPATMICAEGTCYPDIFACDDHADEHECGQNMLLPVVNSPRMGMCGYTGG